jgi:hypothetical protein
MLMEVNESLNEMSNHLQSTIPILKPNFNNQYETDLGLGFSSKKVNQGGFEINSSIYTIIYKIKKILQINLYLGLIRDSIQMM